MLKEDKEKNGRSVFCVMDTSILLNYLDQVEMLSKALARKEFDGKTGVDGKIVIPTVVKKEVNNYFYHSKLTSKQREIEKQYSELIQKQVEKKAKRKKIRFWIGLKLKKQWAIDLACEDEKENTKIIELELEIKEIKDLSERVKKARDLINKELMPNPVWMLRKETKDIMCAVRMLQNEKGLYENKEGEKVKNRPSDNDLIILATAMQLSSEGYAFVVTCDSGLANAAMYINRERGYWRVIVKPNALGPWFRENNN